MKNFLFRCDQNLFERVKVEANSRGISIKDMLIELVERGLLQIYEEERNNSKRKEDE